MCKRLVLTFVLKVVKHCGSGSEFQTVGPKTEKDIFPKVSRQKHRTVSNEVSREHSVLERQYG